MGKKSIGLGFEVSFDETRTDAETVVGLLEMAIDQGLTFADFTDDYGAIEVSDLTIARVSEREGPAGLTSNRKLHRVAPQE